MWFVWFLLGMATGGFIIGATMSREWKSYMRLMLYAFWTTLDIEERYPDLAGTTKRDIAKVLKERFNGEPHRK